MPDNIGPTLWKRYVPTRSYGWESIRGCGYHIESRGLTNMKIFIDSANLADIEEALRRGFARGITTNPSILAKEKKTDFQKHIRKIIDLVQKHGYDIPLSVEVFTTDPTEMITQAEQFVKSFGDYSNLNIKVPIGWQELGVITELRKRGVKVNCTACMTLPQAMMGALAGANFVSLFYGRIRDGGCDPLTIVRQTHGVFKERGMATEIIVGSIRQVSDIHEAVVAGADIVTVQPKFFQEMVSHPKTDEVVRQFLTDFKNWLN